jgi:hypothetical protein
VGAALLEAEAGADDRAVNRARGEHFARLGQCGDPSGDVHRHAPDVAGEHLALAGVQADPHGQPERLEPVDDRLRAAHRPRRRAVEGDEERGAARLHLAPAEAVELAAYDRVVGNQQVAPPGVAETGRVPRRPDDVAEQDRQQLALAEPAPAAREELLDLADQCGRIADARQVVDAVELDVPGAGDPLGHVPRVAHVDQPVAHAVQNQRAVERGRSLLRVAGPVVSRRGERPRDRRVEDECTHALRALGGDLDRQRPAGQVAEQHGALAARAFMTAITSSTSSSSGSEPSSGSDRPLPRRSMRITRAKDASRSGSSPSPGRPRHARRGR